jgi:ketosteroid isomerase-like protein
VAEHPNATLIRTSIDAMNRGDIATAGALIADDVEWHEIGRPEPIRGARALADLYGSAAPTPDFEIRADVHDIVANDDHAIALVSAHARRGDRTLEYRTAEIFHLRDGKITARWAFSDDTAEIVNFFA